MPEVTNTLMTCGRLQRNGRKLPSGVHGMGELMTQVLARYGLEIIMEDGDQELIVRTSTSVSPSPQTHRLRPLHDLTLVSLPESLATC